ncbi:MAG: AI-2E family transporter [Deltaproteobacteria bacterium]|nr:AI-2E family transporter [Deltaproteobacteria bacterium]
MGDEILAGPAEPGPLEAPVPEGANGNGPNGGGLSGGLAFFVGLGTIFMLVFLLIELKFILLPIVLAFLISSMLNPLVKVFCGWRLPRPLAIIVTLALGLGVIWLALNYAMISMTALFDGIPKYKPKFDGFIDSVALAFGDRLSFVTPELLTSQISKLSLGTVFSNFFSSFFSLTGYIALTFVLILYFLPGLPKLPQKLIKAFPGKRGHRLGQAVAQISNQAQHYVLYKTVLCAGQGLLVAGACYLFGVDFAGSWGVLTFLSSFVPKIGALFAVIPPSLVCLAQFGWSAALWLALVLSLTCFAWGDLIEPRILGKSVDLSPTATFLSILLWGWLWGAVGMIIAVPLMAVVKFTCDNFPSLKPAGSLMENK